MSFGINLGLIDQINTEMFRAIRYHPMKTSLVPTDKQYAHKWDDHYKYIFSITNWNELLSKNGVIPLDDSIRSNIITFCDSSTDPINCWLDWYIRMRLLYLYFLCLDEPSPDTQKDVGEYFEFILYEIRRRPVYGQVPYWAKQHPIDKLREREQLIKRAESMEEARLRDIERRVCYKCGAKGANIIKKGSGRYLCKVCGRSFNINKKDHVFVSMPNGERIKLD